jgi:type 1 fimbria pilin
MAVSLDKQSTGCKPPCTTRLLFRINPNDGLRRMKTGIALGFALAALGVMNTVGAQTVSIAVTGNITAKSCDVNTDNVVIDMGQVSVGQLTAVGVGGAISPTGNGTIVLNCTVAVPTMTMTMQDASNPGSTLPYLALSGDNPAQGVGIQMFHDGSTPIPLGPATSWIAGTNVPVGQYRVPITAAYYRTAANVSAGGGNAQATFNVTYN